MQEQIEAAEYDAFVSDEVARILKILIEEVQE